MVEGDRNAELGIASDNGAILGLDVADSVERGSKDRLVTVTNNLGEDTSVTITLDDPSRGTLYVDGRTSSDGTITFQLLNDATKQVALKPPSDDEDDEDESACSEPSESTTTNGFEVEFYCASYDSDRDQTTYKYKVTGIGEDSAEYKDLSHIVFGVPEEYTNSDVVSMSPASDGEKLLHRSDPTTGVSGVKFDTTVEKTDDERVFTYVLQGDTGTSTVDIGLKAGPNTPTVQLSSPGSRTESGGQTLSDTDFTFTVHAATSATTVRLTRQSTIISTTPTPATDTGEDDEGEEEKEGKDEEEDVDSDEDDEDSDRSGRGNGKGNKGRGNN